MLTKLVQCNNNVSIESCFCVFFCCFSVQLAPPEYGIRSCNRERVTHLGGACAYAFVAACGMRSGKPLYTHHAITEYMLCVHNAWMNASRPAGPTCSSKFSFLLSFQFFFFLLMRTIRKQSTTMPQSDTHHTIKMQLNNIIEVNSERNQKSNKKSAIIWYEKKISRKSRPKNWIYKCYVCGLCVLCVAVDVPRIS